VKIRALIFDFDGLILDTETPQRESWREIYEAAEMQVSDEDWALLLGTSSEPEAAYELLERHLAGAVDRQALQLVRMHHELELLELEVPLPGVRARIAEAQAAGLRLAVASSSEHAWVEGLLRKHKLLDAFDVVVCAEDVSATKPAPDLFLKALDLLHVAAEDALVFEDSVHGVTAAKAAGIYVVAVPNQVTRCLKFEEADRRIGSLADHTLDDLLGLAQSRRTSSDPR